MSVRMYQKDYVCEGERNFFVLNQFYDKIQEGLTYSEVCIEIRKDLEKMIDSGFIDSTTAYELADEPIAYNEYAEKFYRFKRGES